ncbi:MAG: CopG family transcriptional regulator [Opitutales bacterium]
MKNITISMPDTLAKKTRIMAAEADTSMSQFLCRLVEEKARANSSYQTSMKRYLARKRGGIRTEGGPLPSRESLYDRDVLR